MRIQVTTMRINGQPLPHDPTQQAPTFGELTTESEFGSGLATQVTVARLRARGTADSDELLSPLVDAKLTDLSEDTFALTGSRSEGPRGSLRRGTAGYAYGNPWFWTAFRCERSVR